MKRADEIVLRVELEDGFATALEVGTDSAQWRVRDAVVARGAVDQVLAVCANTIGKSLRLWPPVFDECGLQLADPDALAKLKTHQSNAVKAVGLFAVWMEPAVLVRGRGIDPRSFCDEIIVDYTGAPGQQPYIYLLPFSRQTESDAHTRLFECGLLAKFKMLGEIDMSRWFKPLVTPVVRVDRLGPGERLWTSIKNDMQAAIRRAAAGRQ